MRFLVDAQLPMRLARWLGQAGHDVLHTFDLPFGNGTPDPDIVDTATREDRIVITKDSDLVRSFLHSGQPRLLLISTGNISNAELEHLLHVNVSAIERAFESHNYVELGRAALLIHQ